MGFLSDLVAEIRRDLERRPIDEGSLMARTLASAPPRDFAAALAGGRPAVIAEVKRASPSAGGIADRDAAVQARAYAAAGAAAVSVLTEPRHFDGSLADLRAAHTSVDVPVLRKDFLVHPSQLIESRAAGADAVLLIASAVSPPELDALLAAAADLSLGVLLETHSDADLDVALATDATVIGVNARDLETLEVDPRAARARLGRIPPGRVAVLESGIATRDDVLAAVDAGASAILVGEALMRATDPAAALRELLGKERNGWA
jgi:indole-3-glycerol phosphate synthase